jgi:hypothetical protein
MRDENKRFICSSKKIVSPELAMAVDGNSHGNSPSAANRDRNVEEHFATGAKAKASPGLRGLLLELVNTGQPVPGV